jgi:hypothetical protein
VVVTAEVEEEVAITEVVIVINQINNQINY